MSYVWLPSLIFENSFLIRSIYFFKVESWASSILAILCKKSAGIYGFEDRYVSNYFNSKLYR